MLQQNAIRSHATKDETRALAGTHERLLLDVIDVMALTGLSRAKIYEDARDGSFPTPKKLGPRMVRWDRRDLEAWISQLPSACYAPARAA